MSFSSILRSTSGCLVQAGDTRVVIDAGFGSLKQLIKIGMAPSTVDAVFLTHWHLDHFAGLFKLIKSRNRSQRLPVFGPTPPAILRYLLQFFNPRLLEHYQSVDKGFTIDFNDIHIEAVQSFHRVESLAWVVSEQYPGNRKVVFSGDTRPSETIAEAAHKADLLIHEATYLEKQIEKALQRRHSTVFEAIQIAVSAEVGALALNHTATRYSESELRHEAESQFPQVIIPVPLSFIEIESQNNNRKQGIGWARVSTGMTNK